MGKSLYDHNVPRPYTFRRPCCVSKLSIVIHSHCTSNLPAKLASEKRNVLENVFSAYLLVCLVCSAIKCAHNEHVFSCLVHACYGCHNRRSHSSARVEVGRGEASKSACCLLSLASTFHIKVGDAIWSRPDMKWPLWCVCALMSGGLWGFSQLKS